MSREVSRRDRSAVDTLTGELLLPAPRERFLRLSVDNARCHLYAICQQEAPDLFEVGSDGRLRYDHTPPPAYAEDALQAARMCPMQAIAVKEV